MDSRALQKQLLPPATLQNSNYHLFCLFWLGFFCWLLFLCLFGQFWSASLILLEVLCFWGGRETVSWLAESQHLLTLERQGQCRPRWNTGEVWEMKGQGCRGVWGKVTLSSQALPVWVGMGREGSNSFFGRFFLLVYLVLGTHRIHSATVQLSHVQQEVQGARACFFAQFIVKNSHQN